MLALVSLHGQLSTWMAARLDIVTCILLVWPKQYYYSFCYSYFVFFQYFTLLCDPLVLLVGPGLFIL